MFRIRLAVVRGVAVEIHHQRGDQRPGQHIRGEHGKHHRLGEGHEQVARHPGKEEHGHKDDADAQRGDKGRQGDLLGSRQNGFLERFAGGHLPVHVLNLDGGVIHQDAHGQRKPAESHEVDRLPQRRENRDGGQNRQRDGQGNDHGRAPGADEEQDHQSSESCGHRPLLEHAADGRAHEPGLIGEFLDFQFWRQARQHARQFRLDAPHDFQRRGHAAFHDGHQHATATIFAHHVLLRHKAVAHLRHIVQVDCGSVGNFDGQVIQAFQDLGTAVHLHTVLGFTNLGGAAGQDQVLGVHCRDDILRIEIVSLQRRQIEIDGDDAGFAAIRPGQLRSLHDRETHPHLVLRHVVDLLLGELVAGQRVLQNRHSRSIVTDHQRRGLPGRHLLQNGLRHGRNLRHPCIHGSARLEEYLDDAHAIV